MRPFFQELENLKQSDLKIALQSFDLVTGEELELFSRLRRSAEGRRGWDMDVLMEIYS
jgi:hypothetical protein